MRKILIVCLGWLCALTAAAQFQTPVKFSVKQNKISDTEVELVFTGQIDAGPHKYTLRKTNYATLDSSLVAIEDKPLTIDQKMIAISPFTIKSNAYGANV